MLKLLENHVKTILYRKGFFFFFFFFQIFNLDNILENVDPKSVKNGKKSRFLTFSSKFSKILPNSKMWKKKPFLELCLNVTFKQF